MTSGRHGRRLVALLFVAVLVSMVPVVAMAADPSAAEREARETLASRREQMKTIVAKMRGERQTAAGPTGRGMAALDDDDLAFLGLRKGHGDCAGMWEIATEGPGVSCTHGLDLSVPDESALVGSCPYGSDCPSPSGWDPKNPPTQIPCYTTGPYVQVLYAYWGSGDYANYKERIRRSVASIDKLFKISASSVKSSTGTSGNRHVRWLMDASCKLKVTAVKLPNTVYDSIGSIKSNLVSRKIVTSSVKTLVFVDNDSCAGGIAELAGSSSKSSTNPSNKGGSIAMVYDCFSDFDPYAGYGATLGAHELMHTLGAVQSNAPHATEGHCWDDLAAPHEGADIMCYQDYTVPTSKFYQRCTPTYPETFDCGKDDYFNPYPKSGYLTTHWNAADNKFLSTAEPSKWETVPKPTLTFTRPSTYGGAIGGTAAAMVSGGVPGIPIEDIDWTVNGAAVESTSSTTTTLGFGTALTKTGGYANGTLLTIGATATDEGGLKATATTKATVWNPYIRLNTPSAFSFVSGTASWSANAYATGGRTVAKVELFVDGSIKSTDTTAPFGGTFTVPDESEVIVLARVTDSAGVTRATPNRTLYVPSVDVRFSSPYLGGSGWDQSYPLPVPAGKTVPLTVAASTQTPGGIDRVEFRVGGSIVATDTTAPFSHDLKLSSTPGPAVEVSATAVDVAGRKATTESVWIKPDWARGSQTATVTPNPVDEGSDISFRLVSAPPSGGITDSACLYIDNSYVGSDCIYPSYDGYTDTITMPASTFTVGSHVASWHVSGNLKADYSGANWQFDTGFVRFTVTGASASPTVTVTGLIAGTKYRGKVGVGATISGLPDAASIQDVTFFEGGRQLGIDYDAPYSATWNTTVGADGPRTITAVATLADQTRIRSAGVDVSAINTWVNLTAPVAGATVSGLVTLTGTGIKDNDCVLESAAFLVDGVVVNTDRIAPFSYSWDSTKANDGSHVIKVRMQLNDGRTLTTGGTTVTVAN